MCQNQKGMRPYLECKETAKCWQSLRTLATILRWTSVVFASFRLKWQSSFNCASFSVFIFNLTFCTSVFYISLHSKKLQGVVSHLLCFHKRIVNPTVGVQGASVGPPWVRQALEWSSHVALLNGDWTIRTRGQRATHRRDLGIAQPSMGGPPPWVSGGVAPDQRTARALEGRRGRVGPPELQGGRWGSAQAARTGDTRADHSGNNTEWAGFSLNGADGVTAGWPTYLALLLRVCTIIIECCAVSQLRSMFKGFGLLRDP